MKSEEKIKELRNLRIKGLKNYEKARETSKEQGGQK